MNVYEDIRDAMNRLADNMEKTANVIDERYGRRKAKTASEDSAPVDYGTLDSRSHVATDALTAFLLK